MNGVPDACHPDAQPATDVNSSQRGKGNQAGRVLKRIARQELFQAAVLWVVRASKLHQFDALRSPAKTASAGIEHLAKTLHRLHFARGTLSYKRSLREAAESGAV